MMASGTELFRNFLFMVKLSNETEAVSVFYGGAGKKGTMSWVGLNYGNVNVFGGGR